MANMEFVLQLHVPTSAQVQLTEHFTSYCEIEANLPSFVAADLLLRSGLPKYVAHAWWEYGSDEKVNFNLTWFIRAMFGVTVLRQLRAEVGEDALWYQGSEPGSFCDICGRRDAENDVVYFCEEHNWCCCPQCKKEAEKNGHVLRPFRTKQIHVVESRDGTITCSRCPSLLQIGDPIYHCSVCQGGNFHLCTKCHEDTSKRCRHDLALSLISVRMEGVRWTSGCINCDGCTREVQAEQHVWFCRVCNDGNFDLCESCYTLPQMRCGHTLSRQPVRVMRDRGSDKQDNFGAPSTIAGDLGSGSLSGGAGDEFSKKFADMQLRGSLMGSIVSKKPDVKWGDVAGLEPAKNELREAVILPIKHPQLFQGKRKPKGAILMYGPPGTGKSYLAKALATEVEHTLFSISSSDLMSKWFGESESLVRQLFELAREKRPAIIFIDEIDALCSNRDGPDGGNEHTARMKTEFLVQVDGVGKENSGILLLAATNRPWELDPAVRRRFQKRIHIPLPDIEARKQLFQIHGGEAGRKLSEPQRQQLGLHTEGFSGSDISNAAQEAMMLPIRRATNAKYFKKVMTGGSVFYTPCLAHEAGAMRMTWDQVPSGQLLDQQVEMQDFFEVIRGFKPSVAPEEIWKCHEWTEQYGMEGA